MSYLTQETMRAIDSDNYLIHEIKINDKVFMLKSNKEVLISAIDSLLNHFDNEKAQYGYQHLHEPAVDITRKQHLENIKDFKVELERKLDYQYAEKIIKKAKKKKDGTLYKRRMYDRYLFKTVANNGSGYMRMYELRYETTDDLTITLNLQYTSKVIPMDNYY